MTAEDISEQYQKITFNTYYNTYFQELASEMLVSRWQWINIIISIVIAVTASGSAVSGWTLWQDPNGKIVWGIISGTASVVSILNSVLQVPSRVQEQTDARRDFRRLRVNLETFRQNLEAGRLDAATAQRTYDELRNRYSELQDRVTPDIIYTRGLREEATRQLQDILRKEGVIA